MNWSLVQIEYQKVYYGVAIHLFVMTHRLIKIGFYHCRVFKKTISKKQLSILTTTCQGKVIILKRQHTIK